MAKFTDFTVEDLLKERKGRALVSVNTFDTISHVVDVLNRNNITSCGVFGARNGWIGSGLVNVVVQDKQFIGIISLMDLVTFVTLPGEDNDVATRLLCPVSAALGSTKESLSLWIERITCPVHNVMEQFSKGIHHALAVNDNTPDEFPEMLSQTDIIRFLMAKENNFPTVKAAFAKTIYPVSTNDVAFVNADATLESALPSLSLVRAVPVLDADGKLVSSLSSSDLCGKYDVLVAVLAKMTVAQYLMARNNGTLPPPIVVSTEATVHDAVKVMMANHIHRVWITSSADPSTLTGVVTCTDVIRAAYTQPGVEP